MNKPKSKNEITTKLPVVELNGRKQKLIDVKIKTPAVKRKMVGMFDVVLGSSKSIFEAVILEEGSKRNKTK